jgi:GAF domain-containing protein
VLWGAFGISRLHRSGALPHRILVVGSRSLLHRAARREALAQLTEDLADRIWLSTRRGVDLDVVWELRRLLRSVLTGLTALRIARYDSVVLLAAPEEATYGRPTRSSRLIRAILQEMAPEGRFLSVTLDPHPMEREGPHGAADPERASPTAAIELRSLRIDLESRKRAAASIARRLQSPRLEVARRLAVRADATEDDDPQRAGAVEALGLTDRPDDERLDLLVERARDAFDTRYAEINVVAEDVQWSLAAAGLPRGSRSTDKSLCVLASRRSAPTIIPDTLKRLPADRIPRLANGRLVRFYAGHPIHSIDGHRIAVLCVYDTRPRRLDDDEISALRDLALQAEARLIGA